MSTPPKIRRDTRVFISAVTKEFGTIRQLVKAGLETNDYHPVEQTAFPPSYRDLVDKLRERISSCDAVVHIAGQCYGAEPANLPPGTPRRSYTQLEYDIARELGKPVYVFQAGANFPADPFDPEPVELQQLQAAHRQRLGSTGADFNPVATREDLDQKIRSLQLKVERLEDELTQVDERVKVAGKNLGRWIAAAVLLTILGLGITAFVVKQQRDEGARQDAARLAAERERIAQNEERQLQDQERQRQEDERQRQEVERQTAAADRQHRQQIEQVQQEFAERFLQQLITNKTITVKDARQRALAELPALVSLSVDEIQKLIDEKLPPPAEAQELTPVDRARVLLAQGNFNGVFEIADEQRKTDRELAMLEGTAALAKFRDAPGPEWNKRAAAAFQRALALTSKEQEPDAWCSAAISAASVLDDLAQYDAAEPLLREALLLRKQHDGDDSAAAAVVLNSLALLLRATNRMDEAEPLMRRAVEIFEKSHGKDHTNVAIALDNLAQLLKATNRRGEAEPLMRRVLAIDVASYGPDHPNVATDLNNLAQLLTATDRLAEAEPLMRRVVTIFEKSYGQDHPDVAMGLSNLAQLLQTKNRLDEAEPLMRRALEIYEASFGSDHPKVAICLNNLAMLLKDTNRLDEAEPPMRRMVVIFHQFGESTGHEHPNMKIAINNYRRLLIALKLDEDEIEQRLAPFLTPPR